MGTRAGRRSFLDVGRAEWEEGLAWDGVGQVGAFCARSSGVMRGGAGVRATPSDARRFVCDVHRDQNF